MAVTNDCRYAPRLLLLTLSSLLSEFLSLLALSQPKFGDSELQVVSFQAFLWCQGDRSLSGFWEYSCHRSSYFYN